MKFETGVFVRSHYKASWRGVIESIEVSKGYKKKSHKLCTVLILRDRCGKPLRKRLTMAIDSEWLEIIEPFELTEEDVQKLTRHVRDRIYKEK